MNEVSRKILEQVNSVIIGKEAVTEKVLMAVLAQGHVLLEDVPGVGKTTMALAFARTLGLDSRRVQFTSDTMPSDIIGFSLYNKETGRFDYKSGAVPSPKAYRVDDGTDIADCQIPMYIFLAERSPQSPYRGSELRHAWFGDIRKGDYRPVVCDKDAFDHGGKRDIFTREEFESAMESFSRRCGDFADAVREERFTRPDDLAWTECAGCRWRAVCRYPWTVKP